MTQYKQESHIRSLLKGISWRFVATTDLVLVVLLITCLYGECSIENALKIGAIEFVVKLAVYYLHERIWQKYKTSKVSRKQTMYKTISWRIVATTITIIISGAILKSFNQVTVFIALTELITKFALYYYHERLWLRLPLGRIRDFMHKKIVKR